MKLSLYEDVDYRKMWASEVYTESDWPVYFFVKLEYTEDWGDAHEHKYYVSISAVSPEAAKEETDSACRSMGMERSEYDALADVHKSVVLMDYGISACLWQETGNNQGKLLRAAREKLKEIGFLFGFWMDRPLNAIGNSGWDFIAGDIGFKARAQ